MLIRCINRPFRDLETPGKPLRKVGDEWEADASRLAEINGAGYGIMAEAVGEAPGGAEPSEGAPTPDGGLEEAPEGAGATEGRTLEDLGAMTAKQLAELCGAEGVEVPSKPRKEQLVSALAARYGLE